MKLLFKKYLLKDSNFTAKKKVKKINKMILIHSFKSKDGQCANICELKKNWYEKIFLYQTQIKINNRKSDVATFCGN